MVFGLYSRFGNSVGPLARLYVVPACLWLGSSFSVTGLSVFNPWLAEHNWVGGIGHFLEVVSRPFHPYIVWEMSAVKFPINSYELYFMAMVSGIAAYVIGSALTQRKLFNLDRLLHRGEYDIANEYKEPFKWSFRNAFQKLIGITPEYTRGDKIIAWSVFGYAIVYKFGLCFVGVLIWNLISHGRRSGGALTSSSPVCG